MSVLRHIRVYRCEKCSVTLHDHGVPGAMMADTVPCPKCKRVMAHTTGVYSISTPSPSRPMQRVAVRMGDV